MWRALVFWSSQALGILVSLLTLTWAFKHRGGFAWRSDPGKQFSWHPTFMIIGLVYIFSHGIVIFRIFPNLKKWPLKCIHMSINLLAGGFAAFALYAIIDERNASNKEHFQSLHSWIGIGALVLYAVQWTIGMLVYFIPCSPNWLRSKTMTCHVQVGTAIFILSVIAAITGIKNVNSKTGGEEKTLLNVLGIFVVVSLLFHLFLLARQSFKYPSTSSRPSSASYGVNVEEKTGEEAIPLAVAWDTDSD